MKPKTKTTATMEDGKPALVPKLRFPEFRDDAEWLLRPIGDSVDLLSGYPFDGPDISQDSKGIRLLRGINITEGSILHSTEMDRYYLGSTDGLTKYEVRTNDLAIGMDGSKVGKNSALVSEDDAGALLIQRVARLRTDDPTLIQFIFLHVNSPVFHRYVDRINTSSGIPHISAQQIRDFPIYFPASSEQRKLVACLRLLDELMAAHGRKVDALKTHKTGLMQQIFPREGETQPRLRFPEFQNAGEWQEKALGAMSTTTIGEFVIKTKQRADAPYPVFNGGRSQTGFYDQYNNEGNKILISARGANAGHVNIIKQRYWAGNSCYSASLNDENDSLDFVYWFVKQNERKFTENQHAANIPAVSKGHVECFKIMLPLPEEQHRIASCLSSLDALITAETQKLAALQTHKRGLMQQLFPSPEVVEA